MESIPTVVTAIACSAAAGKNPWIPLAIIFGLAAPAELPAIMMDPALHASLHGLASGGVMYGLAGTFAVLAILESLADKIPLIEQWLVPISTAWRPFAGVAVASLLGYGASNAVELPEQIELAMASADMGVSVIALSVILGTFASYLATIGKTGARLLLSMVPVPGLRFAHSLLDDAFALVASGVGIAFGDTTIVAVIVGLYLVIGLFTGPLLARLTWIHMKIGVAILKKMSAPDEPVEPPKPNWLTALLEKRGAERARCIEAYTYHAPKVGRCRAGYLILAEGATLFACRAWFRTLVYEVSHEDLSRVSLAELTTERVVALSDRSEAGGIRESFFHLFPAEKERVVPSIVNGAESSGLVRVNVESESARVALPGYAQAGKSVRFRPADEVGSLKGQAALTIIGAILFGLASLGTFVPVGLGYLISPFKRRFVLGLLISGYLALCVWGSAFFGWPVALAYAVILNAVALRDMTRQTLKARVDGYVDKRAFMPPVASFAWVSKHAVLDEADLFVAGETTPLNDGPWRAVVAAVL